MLYPFVVHCIRIGESAGAWRVGAWRVARTAISDGPVLCRWVGLGVLINAILMTFVHPPKGKKRRLGREQKGC